MHTIVGYYSTRSQCRLAIEDEYTCVTLSESSVSSSLTTI